MKRDSRIYRLIASLLCVCLAVGSFGGIVTAKAVYDGSGNELIYNVNQESTNMGPDGKAMGSRPMYQVDLLAGTNENNPLRDETLDETVKNYRDTYLLDVAADFCVFLQDDFIVYDSDAEGRVAVGGDIVINNGYGSYAIGTGDYAHVTELEKLLDDKTGATNDRTGAATVILGGRLRSEIDEHSQLSDVYYDNKVKYETNKEGNDKALPTHKSNKKIVLNSNNYNGVIPSWATEADNEEWRALLPESPIHKDDGTIDWNYTKIDQTQTYLTHLIDFDKQFSALTDYSQWLVDSNPDSQDEVEITFTYMPGGGNLNLLPDGIVDKGKSSWDDNVWPHWWQGVNIVTFKYTGNPDDKKECVYFNLTEEQFEKFTTSTIIAFENIPLLPDGPRKIIDNDGETVVEWPYSYVVVNVPNSGEVHLGTLPLLAKGPNGQDDLGAIAPNYYYGSKVTVFNGEMISRDYPTQDEDTRNNHPGVSAVLYNFTNADTVVLSNNFQGTIFAPGAHVTDEKYLLVNQKEQYAADLVQSGHLSGAIIAKSFEGYTEFGYRPFSGMALIVSGLLEVSKRVEGTYADPEAEFKFRVTLDDTTITHTYGDMEFKNGVAEFTLKAGERMVAKGLPDGMGYTVEEIESGHYVVGVIGEDGVARQETSASGIIETHKESKVQFVNTYVDGTLVLTKSVVGDDVDPDQGFPFTVTAAGAKGDYPMVVSLVSDTTGAAIANTPDKVTFNESGVATVTLKDGQKATIKGLPSGITYTVTEGAVDGYHQQSATGANGNIPADNTATATFVNAKDAAEQDATGSLTVKKTVEGNAADTTKLFSFTISLSDTTINDTFDGVTFTGGKATISLKHGDSRTITGLPAGVTYTVTENDSADYVVTHNGNTGVIEENVEATVAFINTRNEESGEGGGGSEEAATGSLSVAKKVTGNGADTSKAFDFTVMLSDTTISGTYGGMTFNKGVATFKLSHGKSATATGLPAGIKYTVTEASANQDGYTTTATGDRGTILEGDVATAIFLNAKDAAEEEAPKTGDSSRLGLWLALMALAAVGMFVSTRANKRRSGER